MTREARCLQFALQKPVQLHFPTGRWCQKGAQMKCVRLRIALFASLAAV